MELWLALIALGVGIAGFWATVIFGDAAHFMRQARKLFVWFFRLHPSVAAMPYMEVFGGRVEILTDKLLSRPADSARKKQYYEVSPLTWDLIAAHADVVRDQQSRVIEEAAKPLTRLRWICLRGESGSGKSTLAWRVAAMLHKEHRMVVLRVMDKEDPELWYRMSEFCESVRRPICVLADDLFRDSEVRRALRDLSDTLPIVVLATSQVNEYRPGPLRGELMPISLGPPSLEEKTRVLRCLGRSIEDLSPEQRARLEAANGFLVLMIELTSGKGAEVVIRDLLDNLRMRHEPVYLAYEYVCLPYSYGISIPAPLLERLDREGRFHDLPTRDGAEGLIFYDDRHSALLRPGHLLLAEQARRIYETRRSSSNVLRELVGAVDMSSRLERRFFAHTLRSLASKKAKMIEDALPHIKGAIDQCKIQATEISEWTIWRAFHLALDQTDQAEQCGDAALELKPMQSGDCKLLLGLYRERGRERDALPVLERWSQDHPETDGHRSIYLALLERHGSSEEIAHAIDNVGAWLAKNHEDRVVRPAYIALVARRGTDDDVERLLNETDAWLARHPEDSSVRTAFLGLVERRSDPGRNERVRTETHDWLRGHRNAKEVWTRFIALLITWKRLDEAVASAEEALTIHSANANLVTHYLNLMEDKLERSRTEEIYRSLMRQSPRDSAVKEAWGRWLWRVGATDDSERVFQELIAEHPGSFSARHSYGRLLLAAERYPEAEDQFRGVLRIRLKHAMAHDGLAMALQGMARVTLGPRSEVIRYLTDAESEYKKAIYWAGFSQTGQAIFWSHLGRFYNERKRWRDAIRAFDQATNEDPIYFGNYWGKGIALAGLRQWGGARRALETALRNGPVPLGPPASVEIPQLLATCEAEMKLESGPGPAVS